MCGYHFFSLFFSGERGAGMEVCGLRPHLKQFFRIPFLPINTLLKFHECSYVWDTTQGRAWYMYNDHEDPSRSTTILAPSEAYKVTS